MQHWAASGVYPHVQFLCINVGEMEGPGMGLSIAKEFGQSYNLSSVVNGYFERSKMPTFGQLGCSGFIFFESSGNVIKAATPAFLQFGPEAFRWAERMMGSHNQSVSGDSIRVRLLGLKSQSHLNGQKGSIVRRDEKNNQRFIILLDSGQQVSVGASNFEELEDDEHQEQIEAGAESVDDYNGQGPLGIPSIDEEHDAIDRALASLCDDNSLANRNHCHEVISRHFAREEELMKSVRFGGACPCATPEEIAMTAFGAHRGDHELILQMLLNPSIPPEQLRERLSEHIRKYDSLYRGAFRSAGVV